MNVTQGKNFQKEFKKLCRKYSSLEEDFTTLLKLIIQEPTGNKSKNWIALKQESTQYIFKLRMKCRSLKSSSLRIIYYYDGENIELEFIEIYFKGKKENEDKKRIESVWKEKTSTKE